MVLNLMLIGLAITLDPLPLTAFMVILPSGALGVSLADDAKAPLARVVSLDARRGDFM